MVSVTRKAKPERSERRSGVRSRLLKATETLLERGRTFTEISVEDLITEAEVARSTFYAHFEDKGELLLELTDHVTRELEVAASRWYRLPADATRADLRDALAELMTSHLEHRLTLAAVVEAAAYDHRVRAEYERVMARRFAEMERGFRAQQRAGGVRADVDTAQVTPWIGWMTERGLFQLLGDGRHAPDARLDGMTAIIWRTLYEGTRR
jgi:TetR/AcrR family transcriptional regulator, ethionamide resistance regulator